MGELQWALLIVCVVLVVALYVLSRRAGANIGDAEDKHIGQSDGPSEPAA